MILLVVCRVNRSVFTHSRPFQNLVAPSPHQHVSDNHPSEPSLANEPSNETVLRSAHGFPATAAARGRWEPLDRRTHRVNDDITARPVRVVTPTVVEYYIPYLGRARVLCYNIIITRAHGGGAVRGRTDTLLLLRPFFAVVLLAPPAAAAVRGGMASPPPPVYWEISI